MRQFSQTHDISLFEFRNYICRRMPTSIHIVSDLKLITGVREFGISDNMIANALVWLALLNISQKL